MCVCTVHRFGGIKCFVAHEVDDVDGRMWRWSSDASETRSAHKSLGNSESAKVLLHVWHCFEDVENIVNVTPLALAASLQHSHRCKFVDGPRMISYLIWPPTVRVATTIKFSAFSPCECSLHENFHHS